MLSRVGIPVSNSSGDTGAQWIRLRAMASAQLEHSNLVQHQVGLMEQFREFWMENHLCDVVLKSNDGAEHSAHAAVLSAASTFFKKLLGGSFVEANQVQRGQPVEITASNAAVSALLDCIYGGQPEVNLDVGLELLRLAEAYGLPKLAGAIETGFRLSLDSNSALQVLLEAPGLYAFKAACEEKVAADFEACSQHPKFGELSASQLTRILKREDLGVSREETVLKTIFQWLRVSQDRNGLLGMLLQLVDFQSISVENLLRLGRMKQSGPNADELHREVDEALRIRQRKRTQSPQNFQPKRRCLRHWTPDLGASSEALGREVLPRPCFSLRWHEGSIYAMDFECNILCWKPGDSSARRVVGEGARVNGINGLERGPEFSMAISPTREIFVSDYDNRRLLSFHNGSGRIVLGDVNCGRLFCSQSGVLYMLGNGEVVQKLVGSTLQTVIGRESLPADFCWAIDMFVTKEEVIYLLDYEENRILRINPAESLKAVVVGQTEHDSNLQNLFVTEGGTIYVSDWAIQKVLAFRPGYTGSTEVLHFPGTWHPNEVLVQGRSLFVSIEDDDQGVKGIYEYVLPPELNLE